MTLPNVIIIGAQKSGTTSLFDYISQHPDVYGTKTMKDFPFFAYDEYYRKGLEWFSNFFKGYNGEKIILHGYVNYIYHYELSAPRIYSYNKATKMILILRNPVERAYSAYWQARKVGNERIKSFEEAIAAEKERLCGNYKEKSELTYVDHGFYSKQLKFFLQFFDKKDIFIILFDEFIKDKSNILKQVFEFIAVDPGFNNISFEVKNPAGLPRYAKVQNLLSTKISVPMFLKDMIPLDKRIKVKSYLRKLNIKETQYPPINEATNARLLNIYRDDILALQSLIKKELSNWLSLDT